MEAGRCTVLVGAHRARRQPPAHPRAPRPAAEARRGLSSMSEQRPQRVRVTGPPRRQRTAAARPATSTSRPGSAGSTSARCCGSRCGWRCGRRRAGRSTIGSLPLVFHLVPGLADVDVIGMPLPWLLLGVVVYPVLVLLGWRYVRSAERNERDFADLVERGRPSERRHRTRHRRGHARHHRHAGDRHLGAAVLAHHQRLLRRLAHGAAGAERLGDRRRVPLRRQLPRRRRAGADVRRRHALVPGRLDRRLPRAAGARRRAAAPLGRLHAARLRRGPARLAGRPVGLLGAGGRDRLALPAAAVPGRRASRWPRPSTRPSWVGPVDRRPGRARQRHLRRDASHHVRPGVPVLAQAHRAARPGGGAAGRSGPATVRRGSGQGGGRPGRCRSPTVAARASTRRTR